MVSQSLLLPQGYWSVSGQKGELVVNNYISKINPHKVWAVIPIPQMSLYVSTTVPSFLRFVTNVNINATETGLASAFSTVCCVLQNTIL